MSILQTPGIQDVLRILYRENLKKLKRLFIIETLTMFIKFLTFWFYIVLWYFPFIVLSDFYILNIENSIDVYGFLVFSVVSSPSLSPSLSSSVPPFFPSFLSPSSFLFLPSSLLPSPLPSFLFFSLPPTQLSVLLSFFPNYLLPYLPLNFLS